MFANKAEELEYYRAEVVPEYIKYVNEQEQEPEPLPRSRYVKQCKVCGKYKRLSSFYKNPLKSKGVFDECKQCLKERRINRLINKKLIQEA